MYYLSTIVAIVIYPQLGPSMIYPLLGPIIKLHFYKRPTLILIISPFYKRKHKKGLASLFVSYGILSFGMFWHPRQKSYHHVTMFGIHPVN